MNKFIYKKRKLFIIFLAIFVFASLLIVMFSLRSKYDDDINRVIFSRKSGFYKNSFYLKMTAEDDELSIYYTLDGSEPNEESLKYEKPILIEDATNNPNTNSLNTNVTVNFTDEFYEYFHGHGFPFTKPDYLVDKCAIVRAVAIDSNGNRSEETKESFFVGVNSSKYDGCGIISLVIDPNYLFGYKEGIYVLGKTFDEFKKNGDLSTPYVYWDANYRQRGKEWERNGYINVFDSGGKNILNKEVAIRVRGYLSRVYLPKSLNIYSIDHDENRTFFNYDFFNNGYNAKRLTLAAGGNQFINQFSDYMINDRVADLNISTVHSAPYVLFIDGEYWGFYWLTEKFDDNYFAKYYGVESDDVVMIKNNSIEIGNEEDYDLYIEMSNYIKDNDMSIMENYQEVCNMIDIESYIDYYSLMIYISRCIDWPIGNYALWRTRTNSSSAYNDGKWRWVLFDCNSACMQDREVIIEVGNYKNVVNLTNLDSIDYLLNVDDNFASLWKNDEFRKKVLSRVDYIATTYFDSKEMIDYIDKYVYKMEPIMAKTWKRFFGTNSTIKAIFDKDMNDFKNFFTKRKQTINELLMKYQ